MSHQVSITGQITPDQIPMIAENGLKPLLIIVRMVKNRTSQPVLRLKPLLKRQDWLTKKYPLLVVSSIRTMLKSLLTFSIKLTNQC